jgi:glycolate oxidase iron-sulfur subunit
MRTAFRSQQLADPHMRDAEKALRTCVHCGFCTATCPTYLVLGDERDSPRGRIMLMQNMLEKGGAPTQETVTHLDRCLSCLGCRTACPSGVDYSALIDQSRIHIARNYKRPLFERFFRGFVLFVLMRPLLFSLASGAAHIFGPLLPGKLGAMARNVPKRKPPTRSASASHRRIDPRSSRGQALPASGEVKARVLLLSGCVQSVLAPEIDAAATRVFARAGLGTTQLPGCCGSLAYHMGRDDIAKREAKRVIAAFEASGGNAFSITASGCAAFIKDYGRVLADEPEWAARASAFAAKVKDFSELAEPQIPPIADHDLRALTVAYHPPCSLQHGQRIHGRGEALLTAAGFRLAPIPDSHLCCGSAGSYSLLQPEIAGELRARKLAAIHSTGADVVASANVGCLTHLAGELPTAHIAELLDWAGGGPKPRSLI